MQENRTQTFHDYPPYFCNGTHNAFRNIRFGQDSFFPISPRRFSEWTYTPTPPPHPTPPLSLSLSLSLSLFHSFDTETDQF